MSNHSGSYMFTPVLEELDEYVFFKKIGKKKTLSFISTILEIGRYYDCNAAEILEDIGEKLGICYYCVQFRPDIDIDEGICAKCYDS